MGHGESLCRIISFITPSFFFLCAEEQWMTNHVSFLSNHVISYHIIILIIVN